MTSGPSQTQCQLLIECDSSFADTLSTEFKNRLKNVSSISAKNNQREIQSNQPLFLLIKKHSRIGADIDSAVKILQSTDIPLDLVALVVIHIKEPHALPSVMTKDVLSDDKYNDYGLIVDLAFINGQYYDCEMNANGRARLEEFIQNHTTGKVQPVGRNPAVQDNKDSQGFRAENLGDRTEKQTCEAKCSPMYVTPCEPKPEPEPKHDPDVLDNAWRDNLQKQEDWSKEAHVDFKHNLTSWFGNTENVSNINILLLGPIGSGKSSYVNSILSVSKGRIVNKAQSGSSDKGYTKKVGHYTDKGLLKYSKLYDSMGVDLDDEDGLHLSDDVTYMLKENYQGAIGEQGFQGTQGPTDSEGSHGGCGFPGSFEHTCLQGPSEPLGPKGEQRDTEMTEQPVATEHQEPPGSSLAASDIGLPGSSGSKGGHGTKGAEGASRPQGNPGNDGVDSHPRSPVSAEDPIFTLGPPAESKAHCIILFTAATALMGELSPEAITRIEQLQNKIKDIPRLLCITKIDLLCDAVKDDLTKTFYSTKVKNAVDTASEIFKMPKSNIHPIKNYEDEVDTNVPVDMLLMYPLKQAFEFAKQQEEV